jgi:hypothetical protein
VRRTERADAEETARWVTEAGHSAVMVGIDLREAMQDDAQDRMPSKV